MGPGAVGLTYTTNAIGKLSTPLEGGRAQLAFVLLAVFLTGAHLRLTLYSSSGSTLIPNYLMLLSGAILAVMQFDQFKSTGKLLVVLSLFILIQPYFTWAPLSSEGSNTVLSGLQLVAGIVAALAVLYTTSRLSAHGLRKFFLWAWAVLVLAAAFETYGLRTLFKSVQAALYAGANRGIYSADYRDIDIYGQIRPSALASEPSFLADSWATTASLVFLLDKNRGSAASWIRLILMYGIGFLLAPSMKVVFYFLAVLAWHFWPRTNAALVGLTGALALSAWLLYLLDARNVLSQLGPAETGSFFARIAVAPLIGAEALRNFPILGYGIGNHEGMFEMMRGVWQSSGGFLEFPHFRLATTGQGLMTNGFWWQWAFYGVLGGVILSYLVVRLLSSMGVEHPIRTVICTWIVWYGGAGFVDPASWWTLTAFAIPAVARWSPTERPTKIEKYPDPTGWPLGVATQGSQFVNAKGGR